MIKIAGLYKSFAELTVLQDLNFTVKRGEVVAIIGPSGGGKTTLLRSINALEIPNKGLLEIDDLKVDFAAKPSKTELLRLRKKSSMVFQNFNLFPHLTTLENVMEGLVVVKKIKKAKAKDMAQALLEKVDLVDKYNTYPSMLSGGQQQRVAIARSLAMQPKLILFDEPTSSLDIELVDGILQLIQQMAQEKMTMLVVTHEIAFAKNISDRILFISNGRISDDIPAKNLHSGGHSQRFMDFLKLLEHNIDCP